MACPALCNLKKKQLDFGYTSCYEPKNNNHKIYSRCLRSISRSNRNRLHVCLHAEGLKMKTSPSKDCLFQLSALIIACVRLSRGVYIFPSPRSFRLSHNFHPSTRVYEKKRRILCPFCARKQDFASVCLSLSTR